MKARKKPYEIEVVAWSGENLQEVKDFVADSRKMDVISYANDPLLIYADPSGDLVWADSESTVILKIGDYICRALDGRVYPCQKEIFESSYEIEPFADVVEVVRCKYCKWNSKLFKDVMFSRCLHPRSMTLIENQDGHFCGYGERKTDE